MSIHRDMLAVDRRSEPVEMASVRASASRKPE